MFTPDPATAPLSWNPGGADRVLLAGDESSLPVIAELLATLDARARGQVFVEVETADDVAPLEAPGRVMVCWLARDRGQSLRRSVDAWLSEMLPAGMPQEHSIYAWIAADGPAHVLSNGLG